MSKVLNKRATAASRTRHYGTDDPRTVEAVVDLRVANAEQYLERLVAAAPPLTAEQRARLAVLLLAPTRRAR